MKKSNNENTVLELKLYSIPIEELENYRITKMGYVFDCSDPDYPKMVIPYNDKKLKKVIVNINDELYDAHELVLLSFYGIIPGSSYEPLYGWDVIGYDCVTYKITELQIIDDNSLYINGNIFKKITEIDNCYVSEYGVVYNKKTNKFLFIDEMDSGHKYVKSMEFPLYRIVAKYYIPDYLERYQGMCDVHHRNLKKWDNYYSNLHPLTREEHLRLHNDLRGYDTISDETCIEIYRLHYEGKSNKEIEEITGVNGNTIRSIYLGNKRKDLFYQYKDIYPLTVQRRINAEQARELVYDIKKGMGFAELKEKYGTSKKAVNKIKWGEHFPHLRKEFPELKTIKIPE